jgi:hypothetical protein
MTRNNRNLVIFANGLQGALLRPLKHKRGQDARAKCTRVNAYAIAAVHDLFEDRMSMHDHFVQYAFMAQEPVSYP